jgi:hypothetical protein
MAEAAQVGMKSGCATPHIVMLFHRAIHARPTSASFYRTRDGKNLGKTNTRVFI